MTKVLLSIIPGVLIGLGCSGQRAAGLIPFVPVIREDDGSLTEAPELMKDKDFRIGLVIVLTGYEHQFAVLGNEVRVRPLMEMEGMGFKDVSDYARGGSPAEEDKDYRANLTLKAFLAFGRYARPGKVAP